MLRQEQPDDHVIATGKQYSIRDAVYLSAPRLRIEPDWDPEISIKELLLEMTDSDIQLAQRDFLVTNGGHKIYRINE